MEEKEQIQRRKKKSGANYNQLIIIFALLAVILILVIVIMLGVIFKWFGGNNSNGNKEEYQTVTLPTKPTETKGDSETAVGTTDSNGVTTVEVSESSTELPAETEAPTESLPAPQTGNWDLSSLSVDTVPYGNNQDQTVCDGIPDGVFWYNNKWAAYNVDFISDIGIGCYKGETVDKLIYLTMDCGFDNEYTATILDTLKEKGVKATFFVTSMFYDARPDLIQRMINEGHRIGSHTINHYDMTTLSVEQQTEEIMDVVNKLKQDFDYDCRLFRFPTGNFSDEALALVENLGLKSVFWSYAYNDYSSTQPPVQESLEAAVNHVHTGAIYLLHASSSTNCAFLGDWIDQVRSKGYEFAGVYPVEKSKYKN